MMNSGKKTKGNLKVNIGNYRLKAPANHWKKSPAKNVPCTDNVMKCWMKCPSIFQILKNCKLESLTVVRGLSKLSGATLASQGGMSELIKNFGAIGDSLLNDRMEMMATVISESGKEHFINEYGAMEYVAEIAPDYVFSSILRLEMYSSE